MKSRSGILIVLFSLAVPLAAFSQAPTNTQAGGEEKVNRPSLAERSYVLGPEDVIQVSVLGQADFNLRTRIGEDGTVQLPYLGEVEAAGKTARQLEEQVVQALKVGGYFAHPIVSVQTIGFASRNVTVLGSVGAPGVIPIDRPYRLSEILARVAAPEKTAPITSSFGLKMARKSGTQSEIWPPATSTTTRLSPQARKFLCQRPMYFMCLGKSGRRARSPSPRGLPFVKRLVEGAA